MNTELLYLQDAYLKTTSAKVLEINFDGPNQVSIVLDKTIFYPQGGGQPSDQGSLSTQKGAVSVSHVSYNGGRVLHKGKISGEVAVGDIATLEIHWPLRYKQMQLHTAGHIVDQAVKNLIPNATSIDGNHGIAKKCYTEYSSEIDPALIRQIKDATARIITADLPITTQMTSYEELVERKITLPPDLPKNKQLRIMQIGTYPAMPDGGTHLLSTKECFPIAIQEIAEKDGRWRVIYEVVGISVKESTSKEPFQEKKPNQALSATSLRDLQDKIDQITEQVLQDTDVDLKTKYLGKKGIFNSLAQILKSITPNQRKEAGQALNSLKIYLEEVLAKKSLGSSTKHEWIDLTIPGVLPKIGHMHPVSQAMEEITHTLEQIGFTRVRYPEVDWDYYVFEALNMPADHPARDEWETFFIDMPIDKKFGKVVLTAHTSNGQVREMERLHPTPPIRMINIARCYRRQQDATHLQMFHQFEGLVVDKGITIQHLKGTLDYFAEQFYGPGTKSRIRPFHFQFTEPSFEVDFSCHICNGTGFIEGKSLTQGTMTLGENASFLPTKCKFCKSGWHEVGGAGMVHPNVLKAGGINPELYTGFAFGWGIERTYTLKEGLNIDDIRLIYSGDLGFLEQF